MTTPDPATSHADAARDLLRMAREGWYYAGDRRYDLTAGERDRFEVQAAAQATLALVEEQRTASLIAYLRGERTYIAPPDQEMLNDLIRSRLGIVATEERF